MHTVVAVKPYVNQGLLSYMTTSCKGHEKGMNSCTDRSLSLF